MLFVRSLRLLFFAFAIASPLAFFPGAAVSAGQDQVYTSLFSKFAVGGYDPVAYFALGKPVEGSSEHTYEYKGATWRFSSAENLALFKKDPDRYAPQYGGYCAWAVAQGKTAKGDPLNWSIVDGKLYLNYNDEIQSRWEKDIPGFIEAGNRNWPRVLE